MTEFETRELELKAAFQPSVGEDVEKLINNPKYKILVTIQSKIPEGVAIGMTKYGYGLFTTRAFKKNEIIYKGSYSLYTPPTFASAEEEENSVILMETDRCGSYALHVARNMVKQHDHQRQLYLFDSFMNHSCEPSTCSVDEGCDENGGWYSTMALRDMLPYEQIDCDYDYFELDSRDKGISKCECGAANCRGYSLGFNYMSIEDQFRLICQISGEVLKGWFDIHPEMLLTHVSPNEGMFITKQPDEKVKVLAAKSFKAGEKIATITTELFDGNKITKLVLAVELTTFVEGFQVRPSGTYFEDGREFWHLPQKVTVIVDTATYSLPASDDSREFLDIITLLYDGKLSAANCYTSRVNSKEIDIIAKTDIKQGEMLNIIKLL